MAKIGRLSPEEHARVTEAVAAAERGTDGEIVTIVTGRSNAYHDVGLHYAIGAMLLTVALAALFPGWVETLVAWFSGGWVSAVDPRWAFFALMLVEALVFLVVRYALAWMPLRIALTPQATCSRRVRRRAVECFKVGAEKRTVARVGVLLYLSLDERRAEIVADEAIHGRVSAERWGDAMAALVDEVRAGRPAEGMAAAVAQIGAILAEVFPKTDTDPNELPDRLIEL